VYIPSYPGSTFWLSYRVSPPHLADGFLYVFKMLVDGVEIVTWSVDKTMEWQGKCMFALERKEGGDVVRKVFAFRPKADKARGAGRCIEVKVCRAEKKKGILLPQDMKGASTGKTGGVE